MWTPLRVASQPRRSRRSRPERRRTEFGDLRQADGDRLAVVDEAFREFRHRRRDRLRRQLAANPVEADDL
jgi:hypothetical protein